MATTSSQELTVKGESIERIYGQYRDQRLLVNRRYQRKLVWSIDEKVSFIDSIRQGFPVPIILFAESTTATTNLLEIIDGMQRLNAITSFIENDFAIDGNYFDLNTMALTKSLVDGEELEQKTPKLSRSSCVRIASYQLPISIYEFSEKGSVDEVFRRINSGGRKLSRQELRTAGATGEFAQTVRRLSAKIRGDDSAGDELLLNRMKLISITSRELNYGIPVDSIFWVNNGILSKEEVRQSRDEEIVADIVAYMVSTDPPSSRTEYFDDYYGVGADEASIKRYDEIEANVKKRSQDLVIADFQRVYDVLLLTLEQSKKTFSGLLFPDDAVARTPRYFQVVFLALHELLIKQNKQVSNFKSFATTLKGSGTHITIPEGGRWGSDHRQKQVNAFVGVIQKQFKKSKQSDPANVHWVSQLEALLSQSMTEQSAYDFKQGFLTLDGNRSFDQKSFEKILKTCVAISNLSPIAKGYVLVGIADNESTAKQVHKLDKEKPLSKFNFFVTGVEREAKHLGKSLDQFFPEIIAKIKTSNVSQPLKEHLVREIKLVRYYDKSIVVFDVSAQEDPSSLASEYYSREGPSLSKLTPEDYPNLFKRFAKAAIKDQ